MTQLTSAGEPRRRLRHGIFITIGVLGSLQLFYYFGWSGRTSADALQSPLVAHPPDTVETDRGCILLDRTFTSATQPDFTRTSIKQWTDCRTLDGVIDGWKVQHCTLPGSNPIQVEGIPVKDSPSCYPGGYFRIQRIQPVEGAEILEGNSCRLKTGVGLSEDPATDKYATSFLGPDTFRIALVGPEKLSLMQQQSLGECTYAIPYLITRPGRFWVQRIVHMYQGYDALNEKASINWSPEYLGKDILLSIGTGSQQQQQRQHYYFDVCQHCVAWVTMDEAQGLAGTNDICSRAPATQSRQYGIYAARTPIESVRQAVGHPYHWIPARPRCRFHPAQTAFEPIVDADSDEIKAEKADAAKCLEIPRSIYFVGDSHLRTLFSGVMQRLQGRSGAIDTKIQDQRSHVLTAGKVVARSDFDATLNDTLNRINYSVYDEQEESVEDLSALEEVDTVVLGLSMFSDQLTTVQYMDRVRGVLEGLAQVRKARRLASGGDLLDRMNSLKVIWMGMPAWVDTTGEATGWTTNNKILYLNKLVDGLVDTINSQTGGQGMIDRLSGFEITVPFKNSTQDNIHYVSEATVDGFSAELIHKLDLCS
ncbi:hypothetical protein BGZ99_002121 [Dissophora globulifera]|uniref:Uncharacterized protein n=1 Tax=Dissophora globulifera TaxID=979702 RepID=A0A9P6RWK7_9FUNG|nr:hypothetical protein BGZ99_002121 [Dissophora globulifera]